MAFCDNLRALMSAKGVSRRKMASDCGNQPIGGKFMVQPLGRKYQLAHTAQAIRLLRRDHRRTRTRDTATRDNLLKPDFH